LMAAPDLAAPDLPPGEWHPRTAAFWSEVWSSPMAPEYDESDVEGLFLLARLVDDFWTVDSPSQRQKLAGEVRLQRVCFGLTPYDRRRLEWEIDRGEEAAKKVERRRTAERPRPAAAEEGADPRQLLA
jgi:hypothetical protein